jgi:hypothetical protein
MSHSPYPEKKEGEEPLDGGAAARRSGVLRDSTTCTSYSVCFKREREYIRYNYNYLIQPNKLCSHSEQACSEGIFCSLLSQITVSG